MTIRSRNMGLCFDLGFLEQFLQGKIGEMRNEREYEVKAICYPFVSSFCESLCKSMVQKQLNREEMEVLLLTFSCQYRMHVKMSINESRLL